ncbi:hypothetical protein [Streptomyces sp. NPDC001604]|uniref:hypothetical protein n=1 Tax=Streptomyces sp. NPDC001604 TaxID=3364593 RepID=UPI0036B7989B
MRALGLLMEVAGARGAPVTGGVITAGVIGAGLVRRCRRTPAPVTPPTKDGDVSGRADPDTSA